MSVCYVSMLEGMWALSVGDDEQAFLLAGLAVRVMQAKWTPTQPELALNVMLCMLLCCSIECKSGKIVLFLDLNVTYWII